MSSPYNEDQLYLFLERIAKLLAESSWGAEYYRAQKNMIDRLRSLESENALLRSMVHPSLLPDARDPTETLVDLVRNG